MTDYFLFYFYTIPVPSPKAIHLVSSFFYWKKVVALVWALCLVVSKIVIVNVCLNRI